MCQEGVPGGGGPCLCLPAHAPPTKPRDACFYGRAGHACLALLSLSRALQLCGRPATTLLLCPPAAQPAGAAQGGAASRRAHPACLMPHILPSSTCSQGGRSGSEEEEEEEEGGRGRQGGEPGPGSEARGFRCAPPHPPNPLHVPMFWERTGGEASGGSPARTPLTACMALIVGGCTSQHACCRRVCVRARAPAPTTRPVSPSQRRPCPRLSHCLHTANPAFSFSPFTGRTGGRCWRPSAGRSVPTGRRPRQGVTR